MDREGAPQIDWRDGVPVSRRFDDPYYSLADGAAEAAHVFLAGNGLPGRFRDGFGVAELGFGTGLNLLVTWAAWKASGVAGRLRFTSFEAAPLGVAEMRRGHGAWPELGALSEAFLEGFDGARFRAEDLEFRLVVGDARETVAAWDGLADAWYLDGFAPAKNPEMWGGGLLAEVGAKTVAGGSFATYTAAGHVRRALESAGFAVERRPGFGRKRHMSCGVRR